jgi:hypothetical protein
MKKAIKILGVLMLLFFTALSFRRSEMMILPTTTFLQELTKEVSL